MGTKSRILITGLLFILCTLQGFGQTGGECGLTLNSAEGEFNAGHFYAIPALLNACLTGDKLSREQKVRAYLLLSQVYLIIDDPNSAEDSYLKLLHVDPEYVANEVRDPIDVVYLSKKFTATPIFTPHVRAGFSTSIFRGIHSESTDPYGLSGQSSLRLNVQLGAGLDWNITDNFSLCIEADFASRAYKRQLSGIPGDDIQSLTSSQLWVDAPLYVKYTDNSDRKLRPFGYFGFAANFLLSAKNSFTYLDKKPSGSQSLTEGPSEQVKYQHNIVNRSWLIGGGVKYKFGKDFLIADLRYMGGLSNMVNGNQIYYADPSSVDKNKLGNPDYALSTDVTRYRFASDVFRLDNISLSFGYVHPIYDPRRVKNAKTKSVSRKIRKAEEAAK